MLKRLIVVCLLFVCWPLAAQDKGFKTRFYSDCHWRTE